MRGRKGQILGYWDMRSGRNGADLRDHGSAILGYWDMRSGRVQTPPTLDAVISVSNDRMTEAGATDQPGGPATNSNLIFQIRT